MTKNVIRALLVEDNPGDAELAELHLEQTPNVSFDVARVATLEAAAAWLARHSCDIAIVDLNLPDSVGLRTLEVISRGHPTVPYVVVSSAVDEELRAAAVQLNALVVISKEQLTTGLFSSSVLYALERRRGAEQQRHMERVLDATLDAIVVADGDGHVHYVNAAALAFFERDRDELTGERLVFSSRDGAAVELRVTRPGGEKLGELRVVEFEWSGQPAFLATIRDITQQRNMEMQLLMADRLVSLGTLSAGVAHEINNPLAALLANVGVAIQYADDSPGTSVARDDLGDCLRDVREAGERIQTIVRDLKVFARAEEDKRTHCDVNHLLDSVTRMAFPEVQHSARIAREYGEVPTVLVNEARLSQVFLNLIVNAGQAIPPGHIDFNEIRLTTRVTHDGRVAVDIRDTGPGIPPEIQRRLFTPFFTTKPAGEGTGLGLAICQRIVRDLGGTITLDSEVGRGTCFTVTLPRGELYMVGAPERVTEAPQVPRCRVMVIDDDPLILSAVQRTLRREHEVFTFPAASEALEALARGRGFDVILCDVMMPKMTGLEFRETLVERHPTELSKLVFISGAASSPRVRTALDAVSNRCLEKPFDFDVLRRVIADLAKVASRTG